MRYIKYDTALRYIKDAGMRIGGVWGIEAATHFEHEPTIEIIHCGECIFADEDAKAEMYRCRNVSFPMWNKADHFCSDGERKDNEGHN